MDPVSIKAVNSGIALPIYDFAALVKETGRTEFSWYDLDENRLNVGQADKLVALIEKRQDSNKEEADLLEACKNWRSRFAESGSVQDHYISLVARLCARFFGGTDGQIDAAEGKASGIFYNVTEEAIALAKGNAGKRNSKGDVSGDSPAGQSEINKSEDHANQAAYNLDNFVKSYTDFITHYSMLPADGILALLGEKRKLITESEIKDWQKKAFDVADAADTGAGGKIDGKITSKEGFVVLLDQYALEFGGNATPGQRVLDAEGLSALKKQTTYETKINGVTLTESFKYGVILDPSVYNLKEFNLKLYGSPFTEITPQQLFGWKERKQEETQENIVVSSAP